MGISCRAALEQNAFKRKRAFFSNSLFRRVFAILADSVKSQNAIGAVLLAAAISTSTAYAQDSAIKITDAKSWRSAVRSWILAYSQFPDLPRSPVKEGEVAPPYPSGQVIVSFVLDRQGRLVASAVAKSSGRPEFDQAALTNLKRAEPFPKPPSDAPGETFKLTIPIRFQGGPQPSAQ